MSKTKTHSAKYNKVKTYYDKGVRSETIVSNAVVTEWIAAEEYEEITSNPYEK